MFKNLCQNLILNETRFWSVLLEIMRSNCRSETIKLLDKIMLKFRLKYATI